MSGTAAQIAALRSSIVADCRIIVIAT